MYMICVHYGLVLSCNIPETRSCKYFAWVTNGMLQNTTIPDFMILLDCTYSVPLFHPDFQMPLILLNYSSITVPVDISEPTTKMVSNIAHVEIPMFLPLRSVQ